MTETLVGWHRGSTMLITDLGHHAKRWRDVEPQVRKMLADDPDGDLTLLGWAVPDLLNEIDRLRFVLSERERAAEPEVLAAMADGKRCPRCGTTAVLGRWDVCRPCAVAEGWEAEPETKEN